MDKEKIVSRYLHTFLITMNEIESLEEFYHRSLSTVDEYSKKLKKDCAPGVRISQLFNDLANYNSKEEKNKKIEEIKEEIITGNIALKDICNILPIEEDSQPLQFIMKEEYQWKPLYSPIDATRKLGNIAKYRTILVESVLSHIIIIFENYLASILRTLILQDAVKYLGGETIQFAQLINNSTNAITNKIESYIQAQLWDSLSLYKSLYKKEGLVIERYEKINKEFEEIYYRRNAYVHTEGCANQDYLAKVDKSYTNEIKLGDQLKSNDEYLNNAIRILLKLLFYFTFELLMKQKVGEQEIRPISDYFFTRLCNKEYEVSKSVYYALSNYDQLEFADKQRYRVNYINACKQLGDSKTVSIELKKMDVSAMQDQFVIAKYCLEDNTTKIVELLNKSYPTSYNAVAIRDWPIFINFRETEEYKAFVQQHAEEFAIQEMVAIDSDFGHESKQMGNDQAIVTIHDIENR